MQCRSALAAGMHDLRERTPVACIPFGAKRQSRTSLARARHLYAAAPPTCLALCPVTSRRGCAADPAAEHTRLSAASRANIEWLLQCFQADLACPLRSKPILARKAAADACAEGTKVGIGGWFISSRCVSWFAETWDFQEVQQWPCLAKEAQRYIACFETLAQLALMRIARAASACPPVQTIPHQKPERTSCSPQHGLFVQLVAAWAYKRKWSVLASHIPGEHNVWADQLSRGNTSAFDGKPQARFRFRPHDFWPHKCMCRHGERTRRVFPPAPQSLYFQATPYKEKEHAHMFVGRTLLSFAACSLSD